MVLLLSNYVIDRYDRIRDGGGEEKDETENRVVKSWVELSRVELSRVE